MKYLIFSKNEWADAWLRPDKAYCTVNRWEAGRFELAEANDFAAAFDGLEMQEDVLPFESAAREVSCFDEIIPEGTWQCLGCGRIYSGDGAERCARWCCHTQINCIECGEAVVDRFLIICRSCADKKYRARRMTELDSAELVDESGLDDYMVTDGDGNFWPSTDEYLAELDDMEEPEPYPFLFVAEFFPVVADVQSIFDHCVEQHHEDIADAKITGDLEAAVAVFNTLCVEMRVGSFYKVKKKVAVPQAGTQVEMF